MFCMVDLNTPGELTATAGLDGIHQASVNHFYAFHVYFAIMMQSYLRITSHLPLSSIEAYMPSIFWMYLDVVT